MRSSKGLSQKLGGTDVVVRDFDVPALTEEAVGRRVIFNRVVSGARVTAHLDYVLFRQGRALAGLLVGGVDVPFYGEERVRISQLLTDRLLAEVGSGSRPPAPPSTTSASQVPWVPNTAGMTLPRARAALLEAGFISIKANDGAGRGRVPAFYDTSWTVRAQFPGGPTQLPNLPDVVVIVDVLKPGERYTPTTSPCPPLAQC